MKRDMELIRGMLLLIESCPDVPPKTLRTESFLDLSRDPGVIAMHIELLRDAGMIEAKVLSVDGGLKNFEVLRLTFVGYEYLESIRDAKIWRDVKKKLAVVGGATLEIIKTVAEAEITKALDI